LRKPAEQAGFLVRSVMNGKGEDYDTIKEENEFYTKNMAADEALS